MEFLGELGDRIRSLAIGDLPFWIVLFGVAVVWVVAYLALLRRPTKLGAEQRLPRQLTMALLVVVGVVAVVLALPVSEQARSSLLGLLGVLLSASLALSSTTFVSNAMAGLQLRVIGGFRPGDFIRIGDHFGRVTERGLLHTEIQTEDRDLETIPNLFLVQSPLRVVRSSGTIISATVGLGYDVPRRRIEEALLQAAEDAKLTDAFVQVSELGDFAVTYRVAGFFEKVTHLVSARSTLQKRVLDALHGAGIEILSPNWMSQRVLPAETRVIPPHSAPKPEPADGLPEAVMFDKAEAAAHATSLREELTRLTAEIQALETELKGGEGNAKELEAGIQRRRKQAQLLEARLERVSQAEAAD